MVKIGRISYPDRWFPVVGSFRGRSSRDRCHEGSSKSDSSGSVQVPIEKIWLDPKSRADIPAALKGLQHIWSDGALREQLLALLEEHVQPEVDRTIGRPGMALWQIDVNALPGSGYLSKASRERELRSRLCRRGVCTRRSSRRSTDWSIGDSTVSGAMARTALPVRSRCRCWPPTCIASARSCRSGSANANDGDALPDRPDPLSAAPSVTGFPAVEGGFGLGAPERQEPG